MSTLLDTLMSLEFEPQDCAEPNEYVYTRKNICVTEDGDDNVTVMFFASSDQDNSALLWSVECLAGTPTTIVIANVRAAVDASNAQRKLRVTQDGETDVDTLEGFIASNPELAADVQNLAVGDFAYFGGGACPEVTVERVS